MINTAIIENVVENDQCLFFNGPVRGTAYNPAVNFEYNLQFGDAFTDPDDTYWWKETISNDTGVFFTSSPTGVTGVPNGGIYCKVMSLPYHSEEWTKLRIMALDTWGPTLEQDIKIVTVDPQDDIFNPGFHWWQIPNYVTPFNTDFYISTLQYAFQNVTQTNGSSIPSGMNWMVNTPAN